MAIVDDVLQTLQQDGEVVDSSRFRGDLRIVIRPESLKRVARRLQTEWGFDVLIDVTCVDYLHYEGARDRFGLVYSFLSSEAMERLWLRVFLNEPELEVDSLVPLYESANWMEREVYDLFGIRFRGHPDLRRILLPEAFTDHPLRKDYPLQGRGERHHLPVVTRGES